LIIQEIPALKGSYRRIGTASIVWWGKGIESLEWKMKTVIIL
jgi:hypothetical protein